MTTTDPITAAYLRQRLRYDADDGRFWWRPLEGVTREQKRWNTRNAGKVAGTVLKKSSRRSYRTIQIDGTQYLEHRLVWLYMKGEWPPAGHEIGDYILDGKLDIDYI